MLATDLLEPDAPGGDDCRIIFGDVRNTRAKLRASARALARQLQRAGVQAGDRVAVLSAGRMEVIETFFAVAYAGGINVILNSYLKGEMLVHQLELTAPRLLIADAAGAAAAAAIADQLGHQPLVVNLDAPGQPFAWPGADGAAGSGDGDNGAGPEVVRPAG